MYAFLNTWASSVDSLQILGADGAVRRWYVDTSIEKLGDIARRHLLL